MHAVKPKLGWVLIIMLSLSPLVSWYFVLMPFNLRFINSFSVLTSLGQISSLVGFTMFSLNLVLSTRLELFEDFFGGMNKVYVAHHLLGGIGFIFLMLHPLLLSGSFLTYSAKEAAVLLLPSNDWARNLGIASLGCMMSILIVTFYRTIPYHIWRKLHELLGYVFFFGVLHSFFIPSDVSRFAPLRYQMLFFTAMGSCAFLYRTVFGKFFIRRFQYRLLTAREIHPHVVELVLRPEKKPIQCQPGQFLFMSIRNGGVSTETHPFSVSSFLPDGTLMVTIKGEGDYTNNLANIVPGAIVSIEGAFGRFIYTDSFYKKQVWIAGGIGITPFFSMARSLAMTPEYVVDLYYSVHNQAEAVYSAQLQALAVKNPHFRLFVWITTVQGRLTADKIKQTSGDLRDKDFFICGPPPMMKSMRRQLVKHGVKEMNIHSEEFQL